MNLPASAHRSVSDRVYILIWLALLVLTGITIWVSSLQLGVYSVLTALVVASVKAGLVLFVFMHLKYEEPIFKIILLVVIVTLTVIIAMTFLDVGFR
jgi:cytochrome c oxidase subunit 4